MELPFHHKDPFDRRLIGQAISEHFIFLRKDSSMPAYKAQQLFLVEQFPFLTKNPSFPPPDFETFTSLSPFYTLDPSRLLLTNFIPYKNG